MKKINKALIAAVACFGISGVASATTITLDFDTATTGLNIVGSPLTTSAGTITASASGSSSILLSTGGGFSGNGLRHNEDSDGDYAQLAFDFDVSSVTFLFAGFQSGAFLGEVLDSSFSVLDSFADSDTNADLPGGPVTLLGSGIRYFRFSDSPFGGSFSGVDDVEIVTAAIPEPATLALMGLGLAGIGFSRKKKA